MHEPNVEQTSALHRDVIAAVESVVATPVRNAIRTVRVGGTLPERQRLRAEQQLVVCAQQTVCQNEARPDRLLAHSPPTVSAEEL